MSRLMPNVRRARHGLTLPEVLVSFLLLAIIGGGLTRVMMKQQQFYKDASLTTNAKRELRLGASMLPAELRSISSSGGDILVMSENSLDMRAYIGTSIVCARTADDIWVPPTNLARHTLTTYVTRPQVGDTVFIFNENTQVGAQDDVWEKRWITAVDANASDCAGPPFTDPALDPPTTKKRTRYHLNAALPAEVGIGAVVRFTRPVRYKIYKESSGLWYLGLEEFTSGSWSSPSPMAGPFRASAAGDAAQSGLQFRFYDSLGVRVTNMALQQNVARIDVYLRTLAGKSAITERKGADLQDSVLMRVAIRNFK